MRACSRLSWPPSEEQQSAKIIDGKIFAAALRTRVAEEGAKLKAAHGIVPGLATVLVGQRSGERGLCPQQGKDRRADRIQIVPFLVARRCERVDVLARVKALNADKSVHGILVQLPMPKQVREAAVLDTLDPAKDVDALTPTNAGLLMSGRATLVSCTPAGVMMLLKETVGDVAGADALVIGRSLLFGKPAAQLLLAANATVTMAHSRTRDLPALARRADILVAAIGKPISSREIGSGPAAPSSTWESIASMRAAERRNWSAMWTMTRLRSMRAGSRRCPAASAP